MKDRLTTAPLPLERPQCYFVLFVGRRYYLRPNPLRLWHLANSCPGIENGMSGPLLQRIRFPFANRRRETQKITSVKNTKFCKYEVETIAGTRRLQNQPPHTCFFIGPLRGKISSPFAAYVSIFSP